MSANDLMWEFFEKDSEAAAAGPNNETYAECGNATSLRWVSDLDFSFTSADDFTVRVTSTLRDVHWWGGYNNSASAVDDFTIRVFADAARSSCRGSPLSRRRGQRGEPDRHGDDCAQLHPLRILSRRNAARPCAGVTYWLSIVANTVNDDDLCFWATSSQGGNAHQRPGDPGIWTSVRSELAFNLTGTRASAAVPEPSALVLAALGGLGVLGMVRRRRRASAVWGWSAPSVDVCGPGRRRPSACSLRAEVVTRSCPFHLWFTRCTYSGVPDRGECRWARHRT